MNQPDRQAARFVVTGLVQGVGYRAATRREALRLDLSGHAVNLPDGSVEVVAEGAPAALGELESWLHHGPAFSRVKDVARSELPHQDRAGFGVG